MLVDVARLVRREEGDPEEEGMDTEELTTPLWSL
jgi:hypothetical protein